MDIYDTVRYNIKKYRNKRGITQQKLAELSGLSHEYIRGIEAPNMKTTFSLDTVEKISIALEMDFMYLFEKVNEKQPLIK